MVWSRGQKGHAEFAFGAVGAEALPVVFEQDAGARAGDRRVTAAQPRGEFDSGGPGHGHGGGDLARGASRGRDGDLAGDGWQRLPGAGDEVAAAVSTGGDRADRGGGDVAGVDDLAAHPGHRAEVTAGDGEKDPPEGTRGGVAGPPHPGGHDDRDRTPSASDQPWITSSARTLLAR